jgi:hypothetical protein
MTQIHKISAVATRQNHHHQPRHMQYDVILCPCPPRTENSLSIYLWLSMRQDHSCCCCPCSCLFGTHYQRQQNVEQYFAVCNSYLFLCFLKNYWYFPLCSLKFYCRYSLQIGVYLVLHPSHVSHVFHCYPLLLLHLVVVFYLLPQLQQTDCIVSLFFLTLICQKLAFDFRHVFLVVLVRKHFLESELFLFVFVI